ncbi:MULTISPECIES: putative RNA methyltransferase [unclassified Streptomyces]|uniref:putative RNA methyltransferase n=1 Tax=unclassified Streptomyces TaxID=2593676 RepID=UPI002DDB200F|nr:MULTISPECIES: methyltransferase domain-containing protein [unclassified Streptomyces]WSA94193.1 methyltransferase domain-containing protein [Streptomyces sp. NBC_01795]WSB78612.1 methyltransferase domain-containing protein [Streptomyces sp. NBC_01775]WSS13185.1 methyltransferase domain-containing protein [Streptomyces sp. NBC_01186]WSS41967.1 methyltransferase domain-containing protein [Streptomyces sp. NBC_01187]
MSEPHPMRREPWRTLLTVIRCPLCRARLEPDERSLRCPRRHTFDIAKHGYVSLLSGGRRGASADTAAMVQARTDFLEAGHYAPLARTLARTVASLGPEDGTLLDAGAGTGYYLAAALEALPGATGLGLDASPYALRRAARAHPRAGAASWDVWKPFPVQDGGIDTVLNVFAPRNGAEFHRVLRPGGALAVVTPTGRHLGELRREVGLLEVDPDKEERLERTLAAHFERERTEPLEYTVELSGRDVENLASMGPAARHVRPEELRERVAALGDRVSVTASFGVSVYRRAATAPR